jgi:hypothetical protein
MENIFEINTYLDLDNRIKIFETIDPAYYTNLLKFNENGIIKNKYEYGNNECREFIKYFADGKPNHKGLYIDKNNIDSIFY